MSTEISLLTTKLYLPPARTNLVPRPRLLALLNEGLKRPITLISASAGYGKTTLLSEWRASEAGYGFPLAWLSLDDDDNDPSRFMLYLITALRTVKPGIGGTALAALKLSQWPIPGAILISLINDLNTLSTPFGLVLDDLQVIISQPVHEILIYMLDHLPSPLHLVLLTRADPPLPLARLRARNQLTEIRGVDLRFTPQESAAFLNGVMGLELSDGDIAALETRTEGWIAGLQLAALSLRQQANKQAFVAAFAGDDRYVADYLFQEVLQHQSPAVQDFLTQTSILDRLCGPLCDAVTGGTNSQTILAYLEQSNLFVTPLDNRRYWYRYHHLFANLLHRRLRHAMPASDRMVLYRQACAWYEHEGFTLEAVSQALATPDFEYTADLLDRHVLAIFFRGGTALVHHWLSVLPESILRAHPLLCAVYANTLAHTSSYQSHALQLMETWLQAAEQALIDSKDLPDLNVTRSFVALSRAYLAHRRDEAPQTVIALALHALASLPPADETTIDPNYLRFRSGLNFNLGLSFLRLGDEEAASDAFSQTRQIGQACGDLLNVCAAVFAQSKILRMQGRLPEAITLCQKELRSLSGTEPHLDLSNPYLGMIYIALGQIYVERNDLETAEQFLVKGVDLSRLAIGTDVQQQGSVALARLKRARGDLAGALNVVDQIASDEQEVTSYIACHRVRLWLAQGELEAAVSWAEGRQFTPSNQLETLTLARVRIAQRQFAVQASAASLPSLANLLQYLEHQLQIVETSHWIELKIELLILQSLASQAHDNIPQALDLLHRALELAEPAGYMRLFMDEGLPMQRLLARFKGDSRRLKSYVSKLLAAGREMETLPLSAINSPLLIEPLSERELQVLCLLATGYSNAEIAAKLVITLNTTKKHITHIFEKLAVSNRAQAGARARELGLVVKPIH